MFFEIDVLKSFTNFTGKHLCWSFFLITLQAWRLGKYGKQTPRGTFSQEISKSANQIIFRETVTRCFWLKDNGNDFNDSFVLNSQFMLKIYLEIILES